MNKKVFGYAIVLLIIIAFPLVSLILSRLGLEEGKAMRLELNKYTQFAPIGNFTLTDQNGKTITRESLRGKVTVASFFFSRCSGPCPKILAQVQRVQNEYTEEPNLLFLSFTVDSEYDTQPVLNDLAKRYGADSLKWHFLTGKQDDIYKLMNEGFHLAADAGDGTVESVTHSSRLVLLDTAGRIRNYYEGTEQEEVNKMMEHIAILTPKPRTR